jgi:hypothetical protein
MTNAQHDAYICQQELTQDLNDRRFSRYFSSKPLEPHFEFRSVATREQTMPVFDCRKKSSVPLVSYDSFNTKETFNPGYRGPVSGYCNNIDIETQLRNTIFPMQKGNSQRYHIPGSYSDLYNINHVKLHAETPLPELGAHDPNRCNIATAMFDNHTRQQTKNIKLEDIKK